MAKTVYVVRYDVGDPKVSLVMGKLSIRSGGQAVLDQLPMPINMLNSIKGCSVSTVPEGAAQDIVVPHPRAAQHDKLMRANAVAVPKNSKKK